jgi:hypothetical protein
MKKSYFFLFVIAFTSVCIGQVQIDAQNYTTLKAAFDAINHGTHTGAISVQITGNTTEATLVNLIANGTPDGIGGTASYSSITITPSGTGNKTILFTGNNGFLRLNGADNVTIDGQDTLTIANAQPGTLTVMLTNGAEYNTITNCNVLGSGAQGVIVAFGGPSTDGGANYSIITHCNIGPYDGNLPVNGINVDSGTHALQRDFTITYNNIYDFSSQNNNSAAVKFGGRVSSFNIQHNHIYQTAPRVAYASYGIQIDLEQGEFAGSGKTIANNVIGGSGASGNGTYQITQGKFSGIFYNHVYNNTNVAITDNTIKNISVSGSAGATLPNSPLMGIVIRSGLASIERNLIGDMAAPGSLVLNSSANTSVGIIGIYKDGARNVSVLDNSIGGIQASGLGRVDIYGIYMEQNPDSSFNMSCWRNTIGGTNENSIVSTSTAANGTVAGIRLEDMLGQTKDNIIRNLTGYGTGVNNGSMTGVIGIRNTVGSGGTGKAIAGNTIYNLTNANPNSDSYVAGIYQYADLNSNTIERNNIHSLASFSLNTNSMVIGIHSVGISNLYNNMIALGNNTIDAARVYGIRYTPWWGNSPYIFNNSIYIGGTASIGNAGSIAYYQDGEYSTFYNHDNIYVNNRSNSGATGTHSSIRLDNNGSYLRSNIYYGTGTGYVLGYNNTTPKTTLAAWNGWSNPFFDYGYFVDPHFINPTGATPDLHISPTIPTIVEGHGYGAAGDDFDLQIRGNLTPNDIGADAGNFVGIVQPVITNLSPAAACTTGNGVLTITGTGFTAVSQVKIGTTIVQILSASATSIEVQAGNAPISGNVFLTNEFATGASANAFNIYAPPAIAQQPVAGSVCSNATKTFSVTATGAASYQWLLNGVPLTNSAPFSNVTTATLTVTNPNMSYNGNTLSVIAYAPENVCSVTSSTVMLTVLQQPSPIIQASGNTTICAGNSVTLSTTLPYATYLWSNGATTPSILVNATGNYSVTVTNVNNCPTTSAVMAVTVNPNVTYYQDADADLYGNNTITSISCMGAPIGYVANNTDCDDNSDQYFKTWSVYTDLDQDGYSPAAAFEVCLGNSPPSGTSLTSNGHDCDDLEPTVHATFPFYTDADGDGFGNDNPTYFCTAGPNTIIAGYVSNNTDCNDNDATKHQTFPFYTDADNDTHGSGDLVNVCAVNAGTPPLGYAANNTDCDDSDASKHQTYPFYFDWDNDGYGAGSLADVCAASPDVAPMWFSLDNSDCDNGNAAINPGASETLYDAIDNNCDGQLDEGFQITTKLIPADCGATLIAIDSTIHITPLIDVWLYRIKAVDGVNEQVFINYFPEFKMTDFASYANSTTYSISIEVMRNGVWLGYYGDVCQVTTPTPVNEIYESSAIIQSNGGSDVLFDMQAITANADFNGANLGTYIPGVHTLTLKGGQNKIFDYACPISNSNFYYRIYKNGTTPGDFNVIPQFFAGDVETPGGDLWQSDATVNLLFGLANGQYILEVYSSAGFECAPFTSISNNNGSNYKAIFSITSPTPVAVTATSGTATATYANLSAAFNAINAQMHNGDIVITITGNTFEQGGGAMLFPGADYSSIRIVPDGNVTVSTHLTSGAAMAININGGHDITIDGLNTAGNSLTITHPYNLAFNAVPITVAFNNCTNVTLTNCTLLGNGKYIYNAFNNTSVQAGMTFSGQANNNVVISNCDFGASNNQNPPMQAINTSGNNYVITNNKFHDYFAETTTSAGIYNSGAASNWSITNNLFYQTVPRYWQYNGAEHGGIIIAPTNGTAPGVSQGFTITGNVIGYGSAAQTGTYALFGNASSPQARFCGIRFKGLSSAGALATIISNNTITSVSYTGTTSRGTGATSPFVGISFESGVGTCNNNSIGSQTATNSLIYSSYTFSGATEVYGILNMSNNPWTANNNTIGGITAGNTNSAPVSVYGIKSAGGSWVASGNTIGGSASNSIRLNANGASQIIGLYGSATATLVSNVVRNLTANTIATGIYLDGQNNTVSRNFAYGIAAGGVSGIRISGGSSISSNNMVALGAGIENTAINGLYDTGTANNFYNNSVYIGGNAMAGNASSYAFLSTGTGARNYKNNILVNNRNNNGGIGLHYGVSLASASGLQMNRNVYYAVGTGNVLGRFNSQDIGSLANWKTTTAQDSDSFVSDPGYSNPTASIPDLHINAALVSIVESNADVLAVVTEDFDGNLRSGLTPADIGADAGNFIAPPPFVTTLSATSGCPGSSLVINGYNLGNVISVTIGGNPATITEVSPFSVTVTVSNNNTGAIAVSTENDESGTAIDTFTLIPLVAYYQDADGDGYGNPDVVQLSCPGAPSGYVADNSDCDDSKNTIHPNASEIGYNLIDDDCDGLTDEGFPPKTTVIQSAMCNTTLAAINSQLTANIVSGAQGYRWRVTTMSGPSAGQIQQLDTALRVMKLTQLSSYAFNTQYKVEVSVLFAGFWQPFASSSCIVTTPATTTQLATCGQTITAMGNTVYANIVPFASGYRFRITDPLNPANMQVIERLLREFRMNLIGNFTVQYGKTYNVEVSVKNTDGSWLPYGGVCTVMTPTFPTTSLQDSQCDGYMVPTNATPMYALSHPSAIAYAFQVSGGGLPASIEVIKNLRTFTLNDFAGQLLPGATYNIRVRLIFNLSDPVGPYGKTCTITTPGLSRQVAAATSFNAVAYPNPFSGHFNIDIATDSADEILITVFDMTGRLLEQTSFEPGKTFQSGANLPAGVYNIIISQAQATRTLRLIKK